MAADFISYSTAEKLGKNAPFSFDDPNTLNNSSQLFIKVEQGIAHEKIYTQFPKHELKNVDDFVFELMLQPLSDLHFNTTLGIFDVNTRSGIKKSTVEILIALAMALLIIAAINFINLETAQASKRAKEVVVKLSKDLGFTTEAIITFHTPSQESSEKKLVMRNRLAQIEGRLPDITERRF